MGYTSAGRSPAEAMLEYHMSHFKEYEQYDALGLAALIRRRELSAREVLEAAIQRIEAENPRINAVVYRCFEQALEALADGVPPGPFGGVPFLLKDLYYHQAGLPSSQGSRLFADFVADHDSTLVARYRTAGLVILGKTSTPEFGLSATTEPALFGPTRNPWSLQHSAGGSSGGAAAAVAAGCLPMAHATDGGGSIRIPAAACGLFGLKPNRARNPVGPDLGEASGGLSAAHCVSRSVRDSAALLDISHGPEPGDPYSAPPVAGSFLDAVTRPPGNLRIALLTTALDGAALDPECVAAVEDAARLCEALGHRVSVAAPAIDVAEVAWIWRVICGVGLWQSLSLRTAALGRAPREDDVEPVTWRWSLEGRDRSGVEYLGALQRMHWIGRQLADFFRQYDLLLSPVLARPPFPLGTLDMQNPDLDDYYRRLLAELPITPLFNLTGGPAMSVPLAWSRAGLPIGIHFGADVGREALLFSLAAQLASARPWFGRRPGTPVSGDST